jgi:hypothetical protein
MDGSKATADGGLPERFLDEFGGSSWSRGATNGPPKSIAGNPAVVGR